MATGELTKTVADERDLEPGAVILPTGRLSVARMYESDKPKGPFSTAALARLDEALTLSSRETGLDFSIYLGALGDDSRAAADELHDSIGETAPRAVLIAVSPGERVVEIVTGGEAAQRLPDRGAKLAVMSMVASFKEGDLTGGLVSGLRMLTDQAGRPHH